jgi:hypothetical protein
MRFALAVSAIAVINASVFFVACGEDEATPGSDGGTGEGGSSGSSGGSSGGDLDAAIGPDVKRTKDGCILFSTGHKSGKKAENIARTDISGAVNWQNPEGAISEDDKVATIILDDNQESAELKVSDFGLTLPAGAETWGIVVELKRQTQTDGGIIQSSQIAVDIEGKPSRPTFDNDKLYWPTRIVGRHGYGQEVDTWGVDLFPDDVTKASFAAKLWARKGRDGGAPGPITGVVDSLKVAVWYATGPAETCRKE